MKNKLYKKIIHTLARMKVKQMQREQNKNSKVKTDKTDDKDTKSENLIKSYNMEQDSAIADHTEIIAQETTAQETAGLKADSTEKGCIDIIDLNVEPNVAEKHEFTQEEKLDMLLKGMMPEPEPQPVAVSIPEPELEPATVPISETELEPVVVSIIEGEIEQQQQKDAVASDIEQLLADTLYTSDKKDTSDVQQQLEREITEKQEDNKNEKAAIEDSTITQSTETQNTAEKPKTSEEKTDTISDKSIMTDDVNKYSEELGIKELRQELRRVKYNSKFAATLYNTIGTLVVVAAIAILVANLWLPVLQVTGTSMSPTLQEGQVLVASKGSSFKTGDVVAFYYNNKILVKRVIAMPGDWVNISDDGTVYVNDISIDEPYLKEKSLGDCNIELPYQVPESKIFVMGDNRSVSLDSRNTAIGCISEEQVVGKVTFGLWPLSTFGTID